MAGLVLFRVENPVNDQQVVGIITENEVRNDPPHLSIYGDS